MPFVSCPHCDREQSVPRELVGLTTSCKACGGRFTVDEGESVSEEISTRRQRETTTVFQVILLCLAATTAAGVLILAFRSGTPRNQTVSTSATVAKSTSKAQTMKPRPHQWDYNRGMWMDDKNYDLAMNPSDLKAPESGDEIQTAKAFDDEKISLARIAIIAAATLFSFFFYFLPSVIAMLRGHNNIGPIMIVNFAFGWTAIGWFVALAWCVSAPPQVTIVDQRRFR